VLTSTRRRALAAAVASGAALAAQLVAAPVAAASVNPAKVCVELGDLDLSRGACASSVAQSQTGDPDAVLLSGAAYIANCKDLEQTMFSAEGARPYPYQFYKGVLDDPARVAGMLQVPIEVAEVVSANYVANAASFTAANRAGCVDVLRGLHSGALFGMIFPAAP
jgi:hypothetical protein